MRRQNAGVQILGRSLLSFVGGVIGFQLGAYGDMLVNVDTQLIDAALSAIVGALLFLRTKQSTLLSSIVAGIAGGAPIWYLVIQNRAIVPVAILVMLGTGLGYWALSSAIALATTLRRRQAHG